MTAQVTTSHFHIGDVIQDVADDGVVLDTATGHPVHVHIGFAGHPRLVRNGQTVALTPLCSTTVATGTGYSICSTRTLTCSPSTRSVPRGGPLSLGREIPLAVGFVDNLYVSPAGEVTVVEASSGATPRPVAR